MEASGQGLGVKFGKFELVQQIGQGGMATVHRAVLRGMGGFKREVVIKRILPDLARDPHFVKMFIEEAKLSALLDHPNIVQVYDFGVTDGSYYLSMEYIEGLTLLKLKEQLRRRGFPPEAVAFVMHQICLGLDYTHRLTRSGAPLGLVHRDVSPSNVMISGHGEVKLLDFGIAKAVDAIDDELTRTGTLKGKWSYMSPEQVMGAPVTSRSDIFAAGIVLWEILTGRRLFKDKTDYLTLSNVAKARVPSVSSLRPDLPPLFDEICARALAKRPEDRYESAEAMAEHLWHCLAACPYASSNLSALVGPILRGDTIPDLALELASEGSRSGSHSESVSLATGSEPQQTKESYTSLPAGEQAEIALPRSRRLLPFVAGASMLLGLIVLAIVLAVGAREPARRSAAASQSEAAAKPEPKKAVVATKPEPRNAVVATKPEPKKTVVATKPEPKKTVVATKPEPKKTVVATKPEPKKAAVATKPEPRNAVAAIKTAPKVLPAKVPAKKNPTKKLPDLQSGDLADPYGL